MKVKTLIKFKDLKKDKVREVGDEFTIDEKRLKEINSYIFGPLVEVIKTAKIKEVKGVEAIE